jgi:uncharacterized protein YPO0396
MEVVGAAINAAVVAAVGLLVAWLGKGQFKALRYTFEQRFDAQDQRMDRLEARLDRRMDALENRIDAMRSDLENRMDAMRSDLTQVALAVGVRPRAT